MSVLRKYSPLSERTEGTRELTRHTTTNSKPVEQQRRDWDYFPARHITSYSSGIKLRDQQQPTMKHRIARSGQPRNAPERSAFSTPRLSKRGVTNSTVAPGGTR